MEEYRAPSVDRAIALLETLEAHKNGLTGPELAAQSKIPKSTVYRILNSLEAGNIVRRVGGNGHYVLGSRLLGLAAKVRSGYYNEDIVRMARVHLERLSLLTGEASKLSVLDGDKVACIDVVYGSSGFSVAPTIGRRFPIHAGGASKLILAHLEPKIRDTLISDNLESFTSQTIDTAAKLKQELDIIAAQGWAEDRGEHNPNVAAIAAPVKDINGGFVAAVSIAYFADHHTEMRSNAVEAVIACGKAVSKTLAASETSPTANEFSS